MSLPVQAAESARPNIMWIVVDDMSPDLSCYRELPISTQHLDRLAREGTRFAHAYTTAPVCSPSRSAMITGMYQNAIGAQHHRSGRGALKIHLPDGVRPVPALFHEAGYYTCIGDGLAADEPRAGGKRRQARGKTDYNFEWDPAIYDGEDWAGRAEGQPFFMQVMLGGGKIRDAQPATAKALEAAGLGSPVRPDDVELPPYLPRDPALLADWAAYLDSVRLTDHHVGKVLARLEAEGVLENTLVIFMTDHGISHVRAKQFLYDEGTHIPFIVRGPGVPRGAVREDLIEQIDMAPTSLAAAGIPIPGIMQGRDLFAAGRQPREAVFAARDRCDETVERIRSVRTDRFLYIRNFYPQRPLLQPNAYKDAKPTLEALRRLHAAGELPPLTERILFSPTRPAEELYLWRDDPWQLTNLADDPTHGADLEACRARLDRWMQAMADPAEEPEAQYDSDMAVYVGNGNPEVKRNIATMKRCAAEEREETKVEPGGRSQKARSGSDGT
ncbi:MAG: sulfatase [Planctomycetia bacterium]